MVEILAILFLTSGVALLLLRLVLVSYIQRYKDLYLGLGEPSPLRLGDTLALRFFQYFEKFPIGLRVLMVVHFIVWVMAWILPFVLLGHEIFVRN